ncbi:HdeA/HdeB family chaperone, partial [Escherichia coli]|uniref:HdeA/HdeB family chaperone n=1 Tax=Escherichia coli TaxID=562 RepID=UPI0010F92E56
VAALSLVNAQSALAANESAKDMTCQEFIDLNQKAMTPVAWWMRHEDTVNKIGNTVTLNETDITQMHNIIEPCKKNNTKIFINCNNKKKKKKKKKKRKKKK